MNLPAGITVTAAEFTRQFGQLRHAPGDGPVHVTHHGRETHVLLPAARYDELRRLSAGRTMAPPWPDLPEFAEWIEHGVLVLDRDATVVLANATAHAMLDCAPGDLVGRTPWAAVPDLDNSLVASLILHVLQARDSDSADLPSPVRAGRWLHVSAHPARRTTTVLLRDITEAVHRRQIADEPGALTAAVTIHPQVGRLRLNPRGHVEEVDETICTLVGLTADRLRGVALVDLIPAARKAAFREALERVLGSADVVHPATAIFATELLTNAGRTIAVDAALCGLRSAYGGAGAVAVITRA